MKDLTPRQAEILAFITEGIHRRHPPSYREIGAAFGMKVPTAVTRQNAALDRKGMLVREKGKRRSLALPPGTDLPPPPLPPEPITLPWGGTIG